MYNKNSEEPNTGLKKLFSKDLHRLYDSIYESPKIIETTTALSFLAFNSVHIHSQAVQALKAIAREPSSPALESCLKNSPLYTILIPIAAHEYGIDLLSMQPFSSFFEETLDKMSALSEEELRECFARIPGQYLITQIYKIKKINDKRLGAGRDDRGWCRLIMSIQKAFPDHFSCPRLYINQLLDMHVPSQPGNVAGIPVDSTFLRIFGHTIFQPDWVARECWLASSSYGEKRLIPIFIKPDNNSLLGRVNSTLSNYYILEAWVEVFREKSEFGTFTSFAELSEHTGKTCIASMIPWEYSISQILEKKELTTYNETGSGAYEKTKDSINLQLSDAIKGSMPANTRSNLNKHKRVILHVRSSAFYGDTNHRNSSIANYSIVCDYLNNLGYEIYNFSNPELDSSSMTSVFDYNRYKTKRLDARLLSEIDLIISTPSGIGGNGRLFGASELVTNFWPYIFDGLPSSLYVIPKLVVEIKTGKILSLSEVISVSAAAGVSFFEESGEHEIRENTAEELLFGIQDFLAGRMIRLDMLLRKSNAMAPSSFVKKHFAH
jgi:putative glycosyltransferase (TIGR04372 family)